MEKFIFWVLSSSSSLSSSLSLITATNRKITATFIYCTLLLLLLLLHHWRKKITKFKKRNTQKLNVVFLITVYLFVWYRSLEDLQEQNNQKKEHRKKEPWNKLPTECQSHVTHRDSADKLETISLVFAFFRSCNRVCIYTRRTNKKKGERMNDWMKRNQILILLLLLRTQKHIPVPQSK